MNKINRNVFLSYSHDDINKIKIVKESLHSIEGLNIVSNFENSNNNFINDIRYSIENSDIVLIFLSEGYINSKYTKQELNQVFSEFRKRNIIIIPILIEKCNIPSDLLEYQIVDLTKSFEKGLKKILERINLYNYLSIDDLTLSKFEKLIKMFLEYYGFTIVSDRNIKDNGFDFVCDYELKNPFGQIVKELWLVEIKYYQNERFSINNINQIYSHKKNLHPADTKLLLITNSILTSAASEYLSNIQKEDYTLITVIDGPLLKELILKNKRLLKAFRELTND